MSASVLIVDDSLFMRGILKKLLSPQYNIVGEACDGVEAVKMYEELKPDVLTMDVVMPNMDGIQATSIISEKHEDAKIIICTSVGQEEKMKKAINAGAKGYVMKPFKAAKVLQEIESVLAR